jgi:hypothetical protein
MWLANCDGSSFSLPPLDGKLVSMTSPEDERPDNQADVRDAEGAETTTFDRLLAIVAGVLALAAFIWSLRALSNNVVKAFALAGCLTFLLVAVHAERSIKSKKLTKSVVIDIACLATLCICGSVVIVNVLRPSSVPARLQAKAAIEIVTPTAPRAGAPPTSIGCPQAISGSDSIPPGYTVAIGWRFVSSTTWVLQAADQRMGRWRLNALYIQQYPGSGTLVDLVAIIIRTSSIRYYINLSQEAAPGANFWLSTYLPPGALGQTLPQLAELPSLNKPGPGYCWSPNT